ncbi:HNH endonuclease signature motif containing protein [Microbacterium sp. C7(2022)]|uniref:HNH endonuclease signature motif containing protein n=1 Tax=Microbacterium sp. C7(2022) TaxID=2992759 RepID=UPI00237A0FE7|nr:HNH endonuclease signature motif containing protein [Microbacterium sp. C7(2022)]MDE0545379.1 HNH endonuclease [Microbacterium sp. C7(2022)]
MQISPAALADDPTSRASAALDLVVDSADEMSRLAARRVQHVYDMHRAELDAAAQHGRDLTTVVERGIRLELAAALRVTEHVAGNLLAFSDAMVERYPEVLSSLSHARMTEKHAEILVSGCDEVEPELRAPIVATAIHLAETESVGTFRRQLRTLLDLTRSVTLTERHTRALKERRSYVELVEDGMAWLHAFLPAVEALAIDNKITRRAKAILAAELAAIQKDAEEKAAARAADAERAAAERAAGAGDAGDGDADTGDAVATGANADAADAPPADDDSANNASATGEATGAGAATSTDSTNATSDIDSTDDVATADASSTETDDSTDTVLGDDEPRTLQQVRTDVLCDLLLDGETPTDDAAHGIHAIVHVTVPALTLLADTDEERHAQGLEPPTIEGAGPIPLDRAKQLCGGDAGWTRVLTHPESGMVLSVGRDQYRPPPSLRRLVRWRAERCMAPGCHMPASRCEIDHTLAWEDGGTTALENLNPICKGHHLVKHHGGWTVTAPPGSGGALHWQSPTGRHYTVHPERRIPTFRPSDDAPATQAAPF